ncbi:hypothetical protein ACLD02_18765 [Alloalcanivorax sp. C16-2]|uniref:hypothetical protein n=1 Tax=Alloalcanivorax TaxID=3020832 RepID=UPI0019327A0B|nr:hypothetical protein [Alloalcanivorax marinus]MBL7252317.1 hypothetical protein [Alloalcanivorax marinus]
MSGGGINAHWLMHYRVVTLVNQCRRLIRDEFGARLSLTDPDLREELEAYAERSASAELKRLMARIDEEAGEPEAAPEPVARPARRMYRGQPLPDPEAPASGKSETAPASDKPVIYRGRRVR